MCCVAGCSIIVQFILNQDFCSKNCLGLMNLWDLRGSSIAPDVYWFIIHHSERFQWAVATLKIKRLRYQLLGVLNIVIHGVLFIIFSSAAFFQCSISWFDSDNIHVCSLPKLLHSRINIETPILIGDYYVSLENFIVRFYRLFSFLFILGLYHYIISFLLYLEYILNLYKNVQYFLLIRLKY